jgi:beta-ureidopropionase / N-carbamoyl-L-amino-acid hydrolase
MSSTPFVSADLHINPERLLDRIMALGAIGPIRGDNNEPGSARLALTDEDRDGRDLVVSWMRDLDLDVTIDVIGNVVGTTRWGSGAPVMTGSHIDTVRTGGLYDGNLGVLGGLEVVETLAERGIVTDRPLAVAFFTDEEGARFQPDMLGSLVFVGGLAVEEALDIRAIDGPTVGTELNRIGYAGSQPCPALPPHAFVELHVEQGPVLEAEGFTIGAVTGVQGISWQELTIVGQSNHAGTTPMSLRHDPNYVAAAIAVEVRAIARDFGGHQVGTVGKIDVFPNLVNVVPARTTITVDLRNTDEAILQRAEARLTAFCMRIAHEEGVTISTRSLARFEPVAFHDTVVDLVEASARHFGYSTMRLPSGAGHDAQMLARVCPTAMIFTPSVRGISHNPAEHTDPADLEAGANVLLHVLVALATEEAVSVGRS